MDWRWTTVFRACLPFRDKPGIKISRSATTLNFALAHASPQRSGNTCATRPHTPKQTGGQMMTRTSPTHCCSMFATTGTCPTRRHSPISTQDQTVASSHDTERVWHRLCNQFPHMFAVAEARRELHTLNIDGSRRSNTEASTSTLPEELLPADDPLRRQQPPQLMRLFRSLRQVQMHEPEPHPAATTASSEKSSISLHTPQVPCTETGATAPKPLIRSQPVHIPAATLHTANAPSASCSVPHQMSMHEAHAGLPCHQSFCRNEASASANDRPASHR